MSFNEGIYKKTIENKLIDFLESLGVENPRINHYVEIEQFVDSSFNAINDETDIDQLEEDLRDCESVKDDAVTAFESLKDRTEEILEDTISSLKDALREVRESDIL